MSICTESTSGPREPVLQVVVAARVFLGQRVNLQEKYDYPELEGHCYSRLRSSEDFREGVEALHSKRRPNFIGR